MKETGQQVAVKLQHEGVEPPEPYQVLSET